MRLHSLTIEAFGPFGGVVEVDFDELNSAGQFLISGATGAGKTSILDAVCFALYGEVPGERQRAKHLRSDHAPAGAEPRVTLTLTIADRLVRISRSPAWERPKRRGVGVTTQQATVRVEQNVDGSWVCLATRLDEAGHLVNTWLGMTPVQFTQVVLLPQGGFQTFLQSSTAARQAVLQRLFRTDRFERVERWFADYRRSLNRTRTEALHALDVLIHRLAEVSGASEPPALDDGVAVVEHWGEDVMASVDAAVAVAHAEAEAAEVAYLEAEGRLSEARHLVETLDRADAARQTLADLEASASTFHAEQEALRAHERARSLEPLLRARAEAERMAQEAADRATRALKGLELVDHAEVERALEQAQENLRSASHALVLTERLAVMRDRLGRAEEHQQEAASAAARLRTVTVAIPQRQEKTARDLADSVQARIDLASCLVEIDVIEQRRQAAIDLERCDAELVSMLERRSELKEHVQNLRQEYQDAREARIEAMASELATALVVGCSCPVCGSTTHPAPASSSVGVGRKAEDRARRRYESGVVELTALDDVISGLRAQVEALRGQSHGATSSALAEQVTMLKGRRAALAPVAERVETLHEQSAALEAELARAFSELEDLVRIESEAQGQVVSLRAQVQDAETDLATAVGEYDDAADYAARAQDLLERLQAAVTAVRARDEAAAAAVERGASVEVQAHSLGFTSGAEAQAAVLSTELADDIAARETARLESAAAASAVLSDPDVQACLGRARPDLAAATTSAGDAQHRLSAAQTRREIAVRRAERSTVITRDLAAALDAFRPLDAKAREVSALSGLLEGTGADNRLRTRLSAFVLAERLRQVVAAANARLEVISEGRYLLSYQEERGAGEHRGGLSLSILDAWTGISREPSTLSGGETFIVSLCLALGLADTVADETGGLRIDTLFIDEGFGSLDAQTLDSVVDILGQLSEGGRVTGVVSHVMELRERLPAVLEVVSSRSGSTVRRAAG